MQASLWAAFTPAVEAAVLCMAYSMCAGMDNAMLQGLRVLGLSLPHWVGLRLSGSGLIPGCLWLHVCVSEVSASESVFGAAQFMCWFPPLSSHDFLSLGYPSSGLRAWGIEIGGFAVEGFVVRVEGSGTSKSGVLIRIGDIMFLALPVQS